MKNLHMIVTGPKRQIKFHQELQKYFLNRLFLFNQTDTYQYIDACLMAYMIMQEK